MTNHWADIANTTCIIVWGANPVENHPACAAHMNRARFPKQFYANVDTARANKTAAKMIVIDPRKSRTALQADAYVRIRPGSDIALGNAIMKYIIDQMESPTSSVPAATKTAFFNYLNQSGNGTFFTDGTTTSGSSSVATVAGASKYTDARLLVNEAGTDYQRGIVDTTGAVLPVGTAKSSTTISDFPLRASSVTADPNTVYNRLKAHVAPYTLAVAADICGCTEAEITMIADAMIANSRCSTGTSTDPRDPGYRAMTLLYAMGMTQHTYGGQNVKLFAEIQTLLGNMGRAGGGINALRGIHNVQGSTDMGLLYGNIPAYSGNPTLQYPADANAFGKYMDALWGNPLSGRPTVATAGNAGRALMDSSYLDAYNKTGTGLGAMALQQAGFFNMTLKWFGGYTEAMAQTDLTLRKPIVDQIYSLWPKGNGDNHIAMFRNMVAGTVKAAVVWGQNPAVTEPNQGKVREGLKNLDTLVLVDMFENETAAIDRKSTGVTYLIPTAAHVEKAGSATNSGRTLQWRYKAVDPAGNTKDDNELLLRFAEALDAGGAFSHISSVWTGLGITGNVFDKLYRAPYMNNAASFAAASVSAEMANPGDTISAGTTYTTKTVTGSEAVAEYVYREMCTPSAAGGTIWIYTGAYDTVRTGQKHTGQPDWETNNRAKSRSRWDGNGTLASPGWGYSWLVNRRVLYNNNPTTYLTTATSTHEVPGDVNDFFMGPDSCSRLFVSTNAGVLNYSRWYRTIHRLSDKPDVAMPYNNPGPSQTANPSYNASSPHFIAGTGTPAVVTLAGRFSAHTEPYETPREDLAAKWGYNTKGTATGDLLMTGTPRGTKATYPLVLTTIRCVEHFQGGPITRNNPYNHEVEPEPWVELNSTDARAAGIKDGDYVRIVTARNEAGDLPDYGKGFKARVGSGLQSNQRVAQGIVAIPWHWGERGLSTGSRANDLTIDAMDANTTIPEYKACLCRLEKL